jgi:hypothetical protein
MCVCAYGVNGMAWRVQVWRGVADDASIHNPLERLNRLGCGWMGAVFEWEGVLVEAFPEEHRQAWLALAEEEAKPAPLAFALKRADGMKSEQVNISSPAQRCAQAALYDVQLLSPPLILNDSPR